jgi:hypothetical protein
MKESTPTSSTGLELTRATSKVQVSKYTGAEYEYDYKQVSYIGDESIAKYCSSLRQRFAQQRQAPEAAEQWIARTYLATKYLLAASLMLSSARFAIAQHLRIVEPYLLYYALFNASRTLFLVIPEQPWNGGRLIGDPTHLKVQNVVHDCLGHLSIDAATRYKDVIRRALATREMFSYRFPAQGLRGSFASIAPELEEVTTVCQFLAELAQLHSECLESSFRSLPDVELPNASQALKTLLLYEPRSLNSAVTDAEDWYRLWQFARHSNKPLSLHLTARPGLVEDFFGAWSLDEDHNEGFDVYDADSQDWRIIFDFS